MAQDTGHVRNLLHAAGLRLREQDAEALSLWTAQRLRKLALPGIEAYRQLLGEDSAAGCHERELLTVQFSTGESYFFRDQGQIDLLATTILPQLVARRAEERRLRLWSAGCSTGEEAYTLAMLVDELGARIAGWNVTIVGGDINSASLEKARNGLYREWSLRALDAERRLRYFQTRGEQSQICPRLRGRVSFRGLDLVHDCFPGAASGIVEFDLILCRNVFIYLEPEAVSRIAAKFAATLADGGYLITGHNELFGHDTAPLRVHMYAQSAVFEKAARPEVDAGLGEALAQLQVPAVAALLPLRNDEAQAPRIERRLVAIEAQAPRIERRVLAAAAPSAPPADCERLVEAARHHADRGRPDAAAADCRKAIAISAFDPRPYFLLAQLAQERGAANEAKALLAKVIYLDPSFVAAYLELGALHAQAGEDERARRMYGTVRAALARLAPRTVIAPYGESTAADILAYVERLLGGPAAAAAGSGAHEAQLKRSA